MLALRDLAIVRIVLSVSLLLLHQSGRTISISVVETDENTTTYYSRAGPTNVAQSRPTENTTYESVDDAPTNSSLPRRRVTILSKKLMKKKTDSSQLSNHRNVGRHRHSNFSEGDPSSENHVRMGGNYSSAGSSNMPKAAMESGFKPFVPNPAIDVLAPKFDLKDVSYLNEFDTGGTNFKWGLPTKTKHPHVSVSVSQDYPTYSDVPSRESFDASFSKYYDSKDYGSLGATVDPIKICPPNVCDDEHQLSAFSAHKNSKSKPHKGYLFGSSWKNGAYSPHHHQNFVDGFANPEGNSLDANGYDVGKAAYVMNKLHLKNSLLHILTTLIPFGLLLSVMPPKVVIINSTNSARPESIHQKAYIRNLGQEFLRLNNAMSVNDTLDNTMRIEHYLNTTTSDLSCTKLRICEAALGIRRGIDPSSLLEDYSFWSSVLSRSSSSADIDSSLEDIFEAVAQKRCSKFTCGENVTPSAQHPTE